MRSLFWLEAQSTRNFTHASSSNLTHYVGEAVSEAMQCVFRNELRSIYAAFLWTFEVKIESESRGRMLVGRSMFYNNAAARMFLRDK